VEEWTDFFQNRGMPDKANILLGVLGVLHRLKARAAEIAEKIKPEDIVEHTFRRLRTNSPESSESTPPPSPCES
jgi:hypothetical protein